MNAMDNLSPDPTGLDHEHKFAELRTVPGGWDVAPLKQPWDDNPADLPVDLAGQPPLSEIPETESEDSSLTWRPEKFSEPHTIPSGWDTSALK